MTVDGVTLVILVAATHRFVAMWFRDEILRPLRTWVQARGGWIAFGASCQMCVSMWAAALIVVAWQWAWPLVLVLALSALSMWFDVLIGRTARP